MTATISGATERMDFEEHIKPILAENCFSCHGAEKQRGNLRLDLKAEAFKGGDSGGVMLAGNGAESLLVQVVKGTHPEIEQMPLKRDPLSAEQIARLTAWIDQGAVWPDTAASIHDARLDHWAFNAPHRPTVPEVSNSNWPRNALDRFILKRLEQEEIPPAAEADKITLLRRLSLDLIGLPPTIAEVDAYLADHSPDAYERQVERLLASLHYGERWGRHWLDAARYADSDGFEKDKPRFIWAYRDWVINALNRDLPYDQFIIEQIAGDQLPGATQDQVVATGFLRNAMLNEEGGIDPEQFRTEGLFDRMDAIGKSVLGLTIQCAQCHNHKFDPISQEEYYQLFAFLNNDHEASTMAYTPGEQMLAANLRRQIGELEAGLRHTSPDWEERMNQWEDRVKDDQPDWIPVRVVNAGDNSARYYYYEDGSVRAAGYAPTKWTSHFKGTSQLPFIGAIQLEQLADPNLPCNGPGRSLQGMAALTEFKVEATDAQNPTNKMTVKFIAATADFSNAEKELEPEFSDRSGKRRVYGPVAYAIDGKDDTAWGIDAGPGRRNQSRKAVFIPETPIAFSHGVVLDFRLQQNHGGANSDDNQNHNLGRFRISVTSATNAVADPLPANVREILQTPRAERSPAQLAAVFSYWRSTVPEFKEANDQIEALWQQWPEGTSTLTLLARSGETPDDARRDTHLFRRGDWLKPANKVAAGVPTVLHRLPAEADTSRLTLARWLVDKQSPTTARALVNRIWQTYFGAGLVATPEDFGTRAEPPSHPELLDWLACEFMEPTITVGSSSLQPWSLKHLHRLIVTSATYRQSSRVTPELYARDAYNRMLARGPRFRVEGEIVRDIALAASGLLNPAVGGRSIYPPSPEFLYQPPASYGPKTWKQDSVPERYRRSLYIFKFRSVPFPMLHTFDAPNGDFSCVQRLRSNTPLQALVTLNETEFVECAQALARLTLTDGGQTDVDRIRYAFRRMLARQPAESEQRELLALLDRIKGHISDGWVNPHELATGRNESPANLPAGVTPTQLAAYTVVSRVLLNLDETITKE
ncbi:MAG: PSD1 domain-containing protein [Verrucomicrobiae bacterium]|nr:PSD1 domain-containing protein [Verrucomicrobiae bacterium]